MDRLYPVGSTILFRTLVIMEKRWNISGDIGRNITGEAKEILMKYSNSLHESQDKVISKVQVMADTNQVLLKFNIHSAKTDQLIHKLFELTIMDDGGIFFTKNYYNNSYITTINVSVDDLDGILEGIIQSDDMGITMAHLMRIA